MAIRRTSEIDKRSHFPALLVFLIFIHSTISGQVLPMDSTIAIPPKSDTVYIYEDPYIINKTIYIPEVEGKSNRWTITAKILPLHHVLASHPNSGNKVSSTGLSIKLSQLQQYFIGVEKQFRKGYAGIDAGITAFKYSADVSSTQSKIHDRLIKDTLDTYYSILGPDTTIKYVIEERITTDTSYFSEISQFRFKHYYLSLLLNGGYPLLSKKTSIYLEGGVGASYLLNSVNKPEFPFAIFNKYFLQTYLQVTYSFPVFSVFKAGILVRGSKVITSLVNDKSMLYKPGFLSLGIQLKYSF